jgi:hypothetical protein
MPQKLLRNKNIVFNKNILNIEPNDVEYIFVLATSKGIDTTAIGSVFVMLAADCPVDPKDIGILDMKDDEYLVYSEQELLDTEKVLLGCVYDPKTKRLIGLNPTIERMLEKS